MCVCVFFPSILDIKFVGCTSRGHTGTVQYFRMKLQRRLFTVVDADAKEKEA